MQKNAAIEASKTLRQQKKNNCVIKNQWPAIETLATEKDHAAENILIRSGKKSAAPSANTAQSTQSTPTLLDARSTQHSQSPCLAGLRLWPLTSVRLCCERCQVVQCSKNSDKRRSFCLVGWCLSQNVVGVWVRMLLAETIRTSLAEVIMPRMGFGKKHPGLRSLSFHASFGPKKRKNYTQRLCLSVFIFADVSGNMDFRCTCKNIS